MKILFTGASSFTGMWFIHALLQKGHQVTAIFQKPFNSYLGMRKQRLCYILGGCESVFECSFGGDLFLNVLKQQSWDLVCHHAAEVTNYKHPDFDVVAALANNTQNIRAVLKTMHANGCRHLLLTGSVFEAREGEGGAACQAISPYGLSKGLTSDMFAYFCQEQSIALGKFVIANPFGVFEEERFTTYLAKKWLQSAVAEVQHPEYVRDNIPVTLLAEAYALFAEQFQQQADFLKINPSYRPATQKTFALHFAKEMQKRFCLPCHLSFQPQTDFKEPRQRINTDQIANKGWDEPAFWDELANFYQAHWACVR